ncbi:MAG: hypothetical protein NXI24_21700 [bacterium]|nr:hypothetical protein [bacterium]
MRALLYVVLIISLVGNILLGIRYLPGFLHSVTEAQAVDAAASSRAPAGSGSGGGAFMNLKNVRFFWSDELFVETDALTARAVPLPPHTFVDFDNVNAYRLELRNGQADLALPTLQYILNEVVFSYDGSPLRNLKIAASKEAGGTAGRKLIIQGDLSFVLWLGFEMTADLKLDAEKNVLYIDSEGVTALGMPFAGDLLSSIGLDLEALVPVPKDSPLQLEGNRMIVDPYRLFPPPTFRGQLTRVGLESDRLTLLFSDARRIQFPPLPVADSSSGLYIYQGAVKFGKLRMIDTRLQMVDTDPGDRFDFYAKKYHQQLIRSDIRILMDQSVVARVPDYGAWLASNSTTGAGGWLDRLGPVAMATLTYLDGLPIPDLSDAR